MILLDLAQFCFWTVAVLLALVAAVWLSSNMVRRHRELRAERNNIRCAVCGCAYPATPKSPSNPAACPRCGSLNELNNKIINY